MNTKLIHTILAIVCMLSFSCLRGQTFSSGNVTAVAAPVMVHDSTVCSSNCTMNFNITVNSSSMGDSIMIVDTLTGGLLYSGHNTTGANPWTMTVTVSGIGGYSDESVPVGGGVINFIGPVMKIVSGLDTIYNITNNYPFFVANPCSYGTVTGILYADFNNNCTFDSSDVMLDPGIVSATINLYGPGPATGYPSMSWGSMGSYTMTIQQSWLTNYSVFLPPYYSFIFPPSTCSPVTYNFSTLPQTGVDFPVQATTAVDVECWAGSPANARPNRAFFIEPYVSNVGYDTISGQLVFIKDSRVAYDSALSFNPAVSVSGDTLFWNYTNLTSISGGAYWNNFMSSIHLTPNSTVNIGDTLCFRVYTGVPSTDINPLNNDYTICIPVVNSYDPNIKEVSPKGTGAQGYIPGTTRELIYTIHFQNTGTAPAIDINVIDTLDADLIASSLKILGSSNTMYPEWVAPGVVKFNFPNINLADSFSNEPASHGFVRFSVKMHSGLPVGRQIINTGYIYFDSNPAVITNTALNTIDGSVEVKSVVTSNVKVYPNPATDNIFVENLENGNLTIINVNGSVVIDKAITSNKTEIDISRLPAGMYILKTVSRDATTTRKFVKQ